MAIRERQRKEVIIRSAKASLAITAFCLISFLAVGDLRRRC
jgi:hypothetical protein